MWTLETRGEGSSSRVETIPKNLWDTWSRFNIINEYRKTEMKNKENFDVCWILGFFIKNCFNKIFPGNFIRRYSCHVNLGIKHLKVPTSDIETQKFRLEMRMKSEDNNKHNNQEPRKHFLHSFIECSNICKMKLNGDFYKSDSPYTFKYNVGPRYDHI